MGVSSANLLVFTVYCHQKRPLYKRCFFELADVPNAAEEADHGKFLAMNPDPDRASETRTAPRRSSRQRISARLSQVDVAHEGHVMKSRASFIDVSAMVPRTNDSEQAEEPAQIRRRPQSVMLDSLGRPLSALALVTAFVWH